MTGIFFLLSHSHSPVLYYCKYKASIHQLTTGLLAINIFAPFVQFFFSKSWKFWESLTFFDCFLCDRVKAWRERFYRAQLRDLGRATFINDKHISDAFCYCFIEQSGSHVIAKHHKSFTSWSRGNWWATTKSIMTNITVHTIAVAHL